MSGNTGDMKKTTPVLTGASNYLEWKSAMKSLLQVMGVWRYAHTQVAAVIAGQGGATAEQQATYETNRDKALGTITYYTSALIRQNLMNENDPHNAWEQLNTSYGTPGAAGVFVEFKRLTRMTIQGNQDPTPALNQMQSTIGYLASNGLTLPNTAQAMLLLGALPNDWQGFASTLLATLHVNPTAAQITAGVQQLTFDAVLPKIMEEWSRKSGKSIMPSLKDRKEQNAQARPSRPRCKKCSGRHSTADHRDDYKKTFTPNATAGPSTFPPKNQGGGKGKGGGKKGKGKPNKGKGKQHQNAAEQTAQIVELQGDSDDESDAGSISNIPETGWSVLTPSQIATESTLRSVRNDLAKRKRDDEEYAHRLAMRPRTPDDGTIKYCDDGFVCDQYNDESFDCYTLCTSKESDDKCPCLSSNHSGQKAESHCPKHKHLDGLWLMDSGATDHSMPFLADFLTYKKLPKPVNVGTAGAEVIQFLGIGTVAFKAKVGNVQKQIYLRHVYYSPSGDRRICSLQWLTSKLKMKLYADAKITRVFDSRNEVFLEGTRLIPRNNLHWFHGKPIHQTGALGLLVDLDIKSLSTVQCATVTNNFNSYDLWHSRLGHPNPQTMRHATCATDGIEKLDIPTKTPLCPDCQIGKMPSRSFPSSEKRADKILEMVHCDLVEFPVLSYY